MKSFFFLFLFISSVLHVNAATFSDNFSTDTTADYSTIGSGTLTYDGTNERACVTTTGNTDLSFSHALSTASDTGVFSIDLSTLQRTGTVGEIELRLYDSAGNNYKIIDRNGGTKAGGLTKYIGGARVDSAWFRQKYEQNKEYKIKVTYSPSFTQVEAFGQVLTIDTNDAAIKVFSFTVKTKNQNACYDNIVYTTDTLHPENTAPTAHAGIDKRVTTDATVTLDGSRSSDVDGDDLAYKWSITGMPEGSAAALSDPTAEKPTFTADVDGTYVIQLITNDGTVDSAPDSVSITVVPPSSGSGFSDDFSINTTADYSTIGNGTFVYDSADERACVTTTDNTGFSFSHTLSPATDTGTFSIDVNTLQRMGTVGEIELRLYDSEGNNYKIINRNGGNINGGLTKYVGGKRVDHAWFGRKYEQNKNYKIKVTYAPDMTKVEAFGKTLTISNDHTAIKVSKFTLKTKRQQACYDNIVYTTDLEELDTNPPEDTTPPFIMLNGESLITVTQGTAFSDPGAEATDDVAGIVSVTVSGTVDTSTVGSYTLTYTAIDNASNTATVSRTVNVVVAPLPEDTTPPVITLNGDITVTLIQGESYTEAGASATDDRDGSVAVTISGSVDISTVGIYTITYTATDNASNTARVSRTINVVAAPLPEDTTPPAITINGEYTVMLTQGESYIEAGATATDNRDGSVAVTISGTVDTSTVGIYTLIYTAKDNANNIATVSRTVNVVLPADTTPPEITLNGATTIEIVQGGTYTELGATATDDRDGSVAVTMTGTVDANAVGTYTITYSAVDSAGNSVSSSRTVNVVLPMDTEAPVITLSGASTIEVVQNGTYIELGATATDNVEGTVSVTVSGSVDTSVVGSYTLTYTATDKAGNEATETRTVNVVLPADITPPVITVWGDNPTSVVHGSTYTDGGATATDNIDGLMSVTSSGSVDTSALGAYTITYSAADNAGNTATASRSVMVISSISSISIFPSDHLSIFPGQVQRIGFLPNLLEEDKNTITHLDNNPDWVTLDVNNTIILAPPASLSESIIGFTVVSQAEGETESTSKEVTVTVIKKVILVSGELGPDGGKIENDWKDIAISVDAGKLSQVYNISYSGGMDEDGDVSFTLKSEPVMSRAEMGALNIIKPSTAIIRDNYLKSSEPIPSSTLKVSKATLSSTLKGSEPTLLSSSGDTNPYGIYADDTIVYECRPGEKSSSKNEMVWTDENKDGYKLSYVWQGTAAEFDESSDSSGINHGIAGGYPRLQEGKPSENIKVRCASALRSHVAKGSSLLQGRIPILLVHGFISSGKLGGYDHGDGYPGGEYFGKFPKIIDDLDLDGQQHVPFVFQWRTNAKFEDVASELAHAIKLISEETGNKVHIVAHSFGGVLSRTLIQGLATSYPSGFSSEDYIQTLTTVGTPHSGTFGSSTSNVSFDGGHSIDFPEGRNGTAGGAIQNCVSITCYQTGTNEGYTYGSVTTGFTAQGLFGDNGDLYGTKSKKAYVSYKLAQTIQSYPNIPTQALIGLVPADVECKDKTYTSSNEGTCNLSYDLLDNTAIVNPGIGDRLISLQGQRFHPSYLTDSLVDTPSLHIEEHFLPFNTNTDSFSRGMDDDIMDLYETVGINSWNKDNYGTVSFTVTQGDDDEDYYQSIDHGYIFGYNHRTGQFERGSNHLAAGDLFRGSVFSEVGLLECTDSNDCDHGTWNYFKSFVELNPVEQSPTPFLISANGVCQSLTPTSEPLINATTKIFANGKLVGISTTNENGEYNIDIEFLPNTEYYVEVTRLTELRSVKSQVLRTGDTVEESSLHFPIITLTDKEYQEGILNIQVVAGNANNTLNDFNITILNGTQEVYSATHENSGAEVTLPKGDYKVIISKEGYNIGESLDTVSDNIVTITYISIIADNTTTSWTKQFGSSDDDYGQSVTTDSSGNIYVTGYTKGSLSGGVAATETEIFLTKYSSDGTVVWLRQYAPAINSYATSVTTDSSGNIYITGYTDGDIGGSSSGGYDIFLTKVSNDGTRQWTKHYGSSSNDYGKSVVTDSSGNIYVAGNSHGSINGDAFNGTLMFLTKFNNSGTEVWTKEFYKDDGILASMTIDNNGNFYIAGTTDGIHSNIFLTKINHEGIEVWTKQYGSSNAYDFGHSVTTDSSGNIYITGHTDGDISGNFSSGHSDIFLTKFSSDGTNLWTEQYGSSNSDQGNSVSVDSNGNIYITGYINMVWTAGIGYTYGDIFLTKFSSDGTNLWTEEYGSLNSYNFNQGNSVSVDSNGNIYITGDTNGILDGNIKVGGYDIFLTKFSSDAL